MGNDRVFNNIHPGLREIRRRMIVLEMGDKVDKTPLTNRLDRLSDSGDVYDPEFKVFDNGN